MMNTPTLIHTHHADIVRVLNILCKAKPEPTHRASAALKTLLHGVYTEVLPDFAWHASKLTGDGFPLELTFTSADNIIRYTAEAAAPTMSAAKRLSSVLQLVEQLSLQPIPPDMNHALHSVQATGEPLHYGIWVGGRHEGDSSASDRFKIYLEIADGERMPVLPPPLITEPQPYLANRKLKLRIYGYEPTSYTHERYYRIEQCMTYHVYHLLNQIGLAHRTQDLLALIETANGRALNGKIPGGSVGFSFSQKPGQPVVFTLFLFARSVWGGDRSILQGLSELADTQNWDLGLYPEIAAPLVSRNIYNTYHGLFGLVVTPNLPIQATIGLRPPPVEEHFAS
jgi:hypothetical protein